MAEKEYLTADEILSINDLEYSTVKAWGGKDVRLQSLTAGDMIDFQESMEGEAKRTAGLRLIIKSAVDGDGRPIFTDKHLGMLREKSQRITNTIVAAILKLNGMEVKKDGTTKAEGDAKNG